MLYILKFAVLVNTLLIATPTLQSEGEDMWKILAKVEWEKRYEPLFGTEIEVPRFSDKVKELDGKEITISGFVMPIDLESNQLIISALPFASCFFCGKAGPETVLQTDMKKKKSWINEKILLKGRLRINEEDVLGLIYYLEDARMLGIED